MFIVAIIQQCTRHGDDIHLQCTGRIVLDHDKQERDEYGIIAPQVIRQRSTNIQIAILSEIHGNRHPALLRIAMK